VITNHVQGETFHGRDGPVPLQLTVPVSVPISVQLAFLEGSRVGGRVRGGGAEGLNLPLPTVAAHRLQG
jgi:hypothetical protein